MQIQKKEITPALKLAKAVLDARTILPILAMAQFDVQQSQIILTATDTEIEVRYTISQTGDMIGSEDEMFLLPIKKLADITASLSDDATINVKVDNGSNTHIVSSGRSRFSLKGLPVDDFPSRPQIQVESSIVISSRELRGIFKSVIESVATNDVRYYLNGLCFHRTTEGLNVVSTDGHRLSLTCVSELTSDETVEHPPIIPKKAINLLLSNLPTNDSTQVSIEYDSRHIRFAWENITIVSKLIDGRFPDYEVVIPAVERLQSKIVINSAEFKKAIVQGAILSNEKFKGIRVNVSENLLTISARNPEHDESTVELEIDYAGDPFEMGFNADYLLDAIASAGSDLLELGFTDPNSSVLIRPVVDEVAVDEAKFVVMPMRL